MIKKIQTYLLTHYPLIWNTRFVWMAFTLLILHLLFMLAGFAGTTLSSIGDSYSTMSVGGFEMYTFSVLCSIVLVIVWLIFYLRNNAFKQFYIIDRFHLVKEFIIIMILMTGAISFFESFQFGVILKTRSLNSKEQLVKEANIYNLASGFIPQSKQEYFILNNCDQQTIENGYPTNYNIDTTAYMGYDSTREKIKMALRLPDAFSYKNYCRTNIHLPSYEGFRTAKQNNLILRRWIDHNQVDSIRLIIEACMAISKKYGIEQGVNAGMLAGWVFEDSLHNVTRTLQSGGMYQPNQDEFFNSYAIDRALSFTDRCYNQDTGDEDRGERIIFTMYFALCFSILLLCYRLFTRRVFLFSIIGVLVWTILFALLTGASGSTGTFAGMYLMLFVLFTLGGIGLAYGRVGSKLLNGILLSWHIYMIPFVVMIIMSLISDDYHTHTNTYYGQPALTQEQLKAQYPVGYWVVSHTFLILQLNLLFVFLYTAFSFTHFARKWHIKAAE